MESFSWFEFYTRLGCVLVVWGLTFLVAYSLKRFFGFDFPQPVKAFLVPFVMIVSFFAYSLLGF
ncbi:hypothetical protein [Pseudomonas sp. SJZ083]|uniref:hypothetical protein n=1 Tax=Pseudomonas sp. SJZ083 TaxID=2572889 RepID=UPI00119D7C6E|nr:hypothetical protein [Pseudomonas sp. SJZ083]